MDVTVLKFTLMISIGAYIPNGERIWCSPYSWWI